MTTTSLYTNCTNLATVPGQSPMTPPLYYLSSLIDLPTN